MRALIVVGFAVAAAAGLSGCLVSQVHLSDDFGAAARQDAVAQITDPDRRYGPPPPASGARAALAQQRYRTGTVIPAEATASDVGASMGGAAPPAAPGAAGAPPAAGS